MIKKTTAKRILLALFLVLLGIVFFDVFFPTFNAKDLEKSKVQINKVDFNLRILNEYNTPKEPLSSNFKDLFKGSYSNPEYSIIRYNVLSSLFLLIIPMLFMIGILLFLEVSFRIFIIVVAIFGVFAILPLFLV